MAVIEDLVEQVQKQWRRWQEAASALVYDFSEDFTAQLLQVWEASDYVVQCCLREPQLLVQLHSSGDLFRTYQVGEFDRLLADRLAGVADEAGLQRRLRLFRRDQMVRIIWRDLAGMAPLGETLEDLSALADACIDQALAVLYEWAVNKHGVPRDEAGAQQRLVVLGMGKLGARELNLSSDIDLIFTYPEQGQTDAPRPVANEQFFLRLCQQLVKALNSPTVDGFVFRVDVRLRPFGDSGPLVLCFDAMENYYQSNAREWERYAMIKARVVAGDRQAGKQMMSLLQPFIYRRYLDFGAIESIREMKRMIGLELKRKGMADNVKLGEGGIREIEFIGQAFQLIRGGRDPELQIRPILTVLQRLGERNQLTPEAVAELTDAYEFLRLLENRIQAWQDRQTHLLPEDKAGRIRIARSMGFADWDAFYQVLEQHRTRVQAHFDDVFAVSREEEGDPNSPMAAVWAGQLDEEHAVELLLESGFEDGPLVVTKLAQFHSSPALRGLGVRGRERMDELMPMLLESVGAAPAPELTLDRVLPIISSIARRTAYIALLVENPGALTQLVRLTSISPWFAQQLARHPLLLDELLDPRRLYSPLDHAALDEELDTLLSAVDPADLEQQMERLRQFTHSNMLRVAAADITHAIPLMVVSDYLTWIAETVTVRVLRQTWLDLAAKHGVPPDTSDEQAGFAVIGYGKMGGIELGYGSDLDMVFLHANENPNAMTDGAKPVACDVFYARLGQRMIHMFTARTPSGQLYEVDMRLRPNGNAGMLVSSLGAFERYQLNDAWTWEHQALLRARPVAGDMRLIERFQMVRREVLARPRDEAKLRQDVREMREKMRASLDKSKGTQFDIKQGHGGIADIEFMVQYAVLRWAHQYPDLLDWTDNIRLLETLARHGVFEGAITQVLADAYRALRAAYHRKSLSELPGLLLNDELAEEREKVRDLWGTLMEG